MSKIRVTVWNENLHEVQSQAVKAIYPDGIHNCIKAFLNKDPDLEVTAVSLDMPDQGMPDALIEQTDDLIWWGHMGHHLVSDELVSKLYHRVQNGMGLIALHSAHASKLFTRLMGTESYNMTWRESNDRTLVWVTEPNHPITKGLGRYIDLTAEEMYCEPLFFPSPEELLFINWYSSGEVMRSGMVFKRGNGKIFYFQPGHETYPIYHYPDIQKVITNAVHYVYSGIKAQEAFSCPPPSIPKKD